MGNTSINPSIAVAASGRVTCVLVSTIFIISHALFAVAQLSSALEDCPTLPGLSNWTADCTADDDWMLARVSLDASISFEATGLMSLVIGSFASSACDASCTPAGAQNSSTRCSLMECDQCLALGGLVLSQSCSTDVHQTLLTVSTYGGVYMLWYQDTSPLCLSGHEPVCTGVHPYFWVGCVFFAVSVCWPHLKLLLLHVCFYAPMRTARRRNALYWLTFGGKYTLMDALSMVVLLGLYRIQIPIRFSDAFALLGGECKPICEALTNSTGDCTHACAAIEQATNHARLPKGTIDAQLAMEGLVAMVCFCCAVLLSILASVVVDSLEESQRLEHAQAKRRKSATAGAIDAACAPDDRIALTLGDAVDTNGVAAAEETDAAAHERRLRIAASFFEDANKLLASGVRGPTPSRGGSPIGSTIGSPLNSRLRGGSPNSHLARAMRELEVTPARTHLLLESPRAATPPTLVEEHRRGRDRSLHRGRLRAHGTRCRLAAHIGSLLIQETLALCAVSTPFFTQQLSGSAIALVLDAMGAKTLDRSFSLIELVGLMPAGLQPALINTLTFCFFIVVCPLLQPLLGACVLAGYAAGWPAGLLRRLHRLATYLTYASGLEVTVLVVVLIQNSQFSGKGTQSLLNDEVLPACDGLAQLYPDEGHCFQMDLGVSTGFWFAIAASIAFFVSGVAGSSTHRLTHQLLFPADEDPLPPHC